MYVQHTHVYVYVYVCVCVYVYVYVHIYIYRQKPQISELRADATDLLKRPSVGRSLLKAQGLSLNSEAYDLESWTVGNRPRSGFRV